MDELTDLQKELADLLISTKTQAKVLRRKTNPDGSFNFYNIVRDTSPIDFPANEEEFAIKIHEKIPDAPLSPIYVSLRNLPEDLLNKIGQVLAEVKLDQKVDFCTGVPKTAVVLAEEFSSLSGIPFIDVFEKIGLDTKRKIVMKDGAQPGNAKRLLVIDDVISQGNSKFESIKAAEDFGYEVSILVLIDREQGGYDQLIQDGYKIYRATKISDLLEYYQSKNVVTKNQQNSIKSYLSKSYIIKKKPNIIRLPGLIDTHVHLREPGATLKEDFSSGTKAAIAGVYTQVLDMPNNPIPTVTPETLQEKNELAIGRIFCDVGFHFGGTKDSSKYFEEVSDKVFGLKVYMNHTTGTLLVEADEDLQKIFSLWPKDKVLMVHAEDQTLIEAIDLAKYYKNKLHVCHVAQKSELVEIIKAKKEGMVITCEVSAHHLFLTEGDVKKLGAFGMMRPPLASKEDQEFLWENIEFIDIIASDHAPHTREEKSMDPSPNGIPGLETTLPLLLNAINDGRLMINDLKRMCCDRPKEIFNIPKQEDTYVEVDMDQEWIISNEGLFTKAGWTPFEGLEVKGKIVKVVLRGETVFEDGQIIDGPKGKVIYPK